jgi:hypothetical protein
VERQPLASNKGNQLDYNLIPILLRYSAEEMKHLASRIGSYRVCITPHHSFRKSSLVELQCIVERQPLASYIGNWLDYTVPKKKEKER